MRTIKFKGLRKDGKGWAIGHLMYNYEDLEGFYVIGENVAQFNRVLLESVGEYTGLKDMNNIESFEGDMIAFEMNEFIVRLPITFKNGCFVVEQERGSYLSLDDLNEIKGFQVIGNIHDNSEILGHR